MPTDLPHHDCVALESQLNDELWTFQEAGRGRVRVNPRMITTDIMVAREMAMSGVGIAMLTHALSEPDVKVGRLVRVLPQWDLPPVIIAAMFLERRHMPLRTRAFIDLIAQAIRSDLALVGSLPG